MSRVTRRKHVLKEMMEDEYDLPKDNQQIVRVVRCLGNNLHEVESAEVNAEHFLVSMPTKFRKNIWIKRGDYLLVEPIKEGDKVKAEICKILLDDYIKEYTKANIWPERFAKKNNQYNVKVTKYIDSDSEDDLEPNMNRPITSLRNAEESSEDDICRSSEED